MKICKNEIIDFYSANFTEDEIEWTVGATFLNGEVIRWGHYLYKYTGVSGTNSTNNPTIDTLQWEYYRASNYYSMIGGNTKDQTINADTIDVTIDLNRYDTISLLNMDAESVELTITDNITSDILLNTMYDLTYREVTNYTQFFFAPFKYRRRIYIPIPFYSQARARIEINKIGGVAKCGRLIVGRSEDLGITLFGITADLDTYSREELTSFGDIIQVSDNPTYRNTFRIKVPSQNFEYLKDLRKDLDFIQVLFIGDEEDNSRFQSLLSYGYWENASIPLDNPVLSEMTLTNKETL